MKNGIGVNNENNLIVHSSNQDVLDLSNTLSFLNEQLYVQISAEGFEGVEWENIPDEFLLYIYLHKDTQINRKRSERTKAKYIETLRPFLEYARTYGGLRQLTPQLVYAYQLHLERERDYQATTLSRHSTVIKQFLRFLRNEDILSTDLTYKMVKVAKPKNELVDRDLHEEEVEELLHYFRSKDWFTYTMLAVLTTTGMRIEELATAKWKDVHWRIAEQAYFLEIEGKGKKIRPVLLFEDVLDILKELRARRGCEINRFEGETAFFPKANGDHYHPAYLSAVFSERVNAVPFDFIKNRKDPITPHTCRHYATYYMLEHGADIASVRDMLGHASVQTTERYMLNKRKYREHAALKIKKRRLFSQ
ncbi:tyrosine-type recombinase/integrase [Bacillus piscicola]|uniref:tyrosine-type recombinase/integrase n=1 Tax=Bacillus piscicola TaxID=1632684 RepID=UPI001F08BD40|nr:tyrosine-type recombinase/integrase [Bacillus piscicola]